MRRHWCFIEANPSASPRICLVCDHTEAVLQVFFSTLSISCSFRSVSYQIGCVCNTVSGIVLAFLPPSSLYLLYTTCCHTLFPLKGGGSPARTLHECGHRPSCSCATDPFTQKRSDSCQEEKTPPQLRVKGTLNNTLFYNFFFLSW